MPDTFNIELSHKFNIHTPIPELIADISDWVTNCVQLLHREAPYSDALEAPQEIDVPKMPVRIQLLVDLS